MGVTARRRQQTTNTIVSSGLHARRGTNSDRNSHAGQVVVTLLLLIGTLWQIPIRLLTTAANNCVYT